MTLVYAERTGLQVRLWADTAVTNREAAHINIIPGVLKTVILGRQFVVSFAGSVSGCLDVIRRIRNSGRDQISVDVTLDRLCSHTAHHPKDAEFLVLNHEKIYRITNGNCISGGDAYWIGDPEAASQFLTLRKASLAKEPAHADTFHANHPSFGMVVDDPQFPNVGGLCTLVVRARDGYIYERGIHVVGAQPIPPGATILVGDEGPAIGGYAHTFLVPAEPGHPFAAVYFPPGRTGFLYRPLDTDEPSQVSDIGWYDFIAMVEAECGIAFHGLTLPINVNGRQR